MSFGARPGASVSAGLSAGLSAGASAGLSAGTSAGLSAGTSASVSARAIVTNVQSRMMCKRDHSRNRCGARHFPGSAGQRNAHAI